MPNIWYESAWWNEPFYGENDLGKSYRDTVGFLWARNEEVTEGAPAVAAQPFHFFRPTTFELGPCELNQRGYITRV